MAQSRAADDFAVIRGRMEELRRERVRSGGGRGVEPAIENRDTAGAPVGKSVLRLLRQRGRLLR